MTEVRQQRECNQCGQVDDHPRVIIDHDLPSQRMVHYDCLPADLREGEIGDWAQIAEGGTKGDDLRLVIMPDGDGPAASEYDGEGI